MRVDDRVADRVKLATPRRLRGIRALLALLERHVARGFFARLVEAGAAEPGNVQGEGLVIAGGGILVAEKGAGAVADEGHAVSGKLAA